MSTQDESVSIGVAFSLSLSLSLSSLTPSYLVKIVIPLFLCDDILHLLIHILLNSPIRNAYTHKIL